MIFGNIFVYKYFVVVGIFMFSICINCLELVFLMLMVFCWGVIGSIFFGVVENIFFFEINFFDRVLKRGR